MPAITLSNQALSGPSSPRISTMQSVSRPSRLGAKPIPTTSFDKSAFISPVLYSSQPDRISTPPLQPQRPTGYTIPPPPLSSPQKPNYNLSFSDINSTTLSTITPAPRYIPSSYTPLQPASPAFPVPSPPLHASPLSMGSILAPSQPARPTTATRPISRDDWGDFDPLK